MPIHGSGLTDDKTKSVHYSARVWGSKEIRRTSDKVEVHHADKEAALAVLLISHHQALLHAKVHIACHRAESGKMSQKIADRRRQMCPTLSAMRLSTRATRASWYCKISGALRSFWYACISAVIGLSLNSRYCGCA